MFNPSCSFRFETYQFFNETRLQELEFVSPPPPPSPVVKPSPSGNDNSLSSSVKNLFLV